MAALRRVSGKAPRIAGPPSRSMMRDDPGSKCRKSRASECREISASAPAISTPVGPPPMTTNVSCASCRAGSVSRSARSNASSIARRISSASSSVLSPGASAATRRGRSRHGSRQSPRSGSRSRDAVPQEDRLAGRSTPVASREDDFGVPLPAQDPTDRRRDLPGRERRHRHLIQERLKDMVVAPIDDRHLHPRPPERPRGIEAAESSPDNDHTVPYSTIPSSAVRFRPLFRLSAKPRPRA